VIVQRIRESAAMIVVHTHRYPVNGYLPSLWLQREPIITGILEKPVFEFYERGIRKEALLRDISINQIPFSSYELSSRSGRNRIRGWLEHFWWHVDLLRRSWIPLTTTIGAIGGGLSTRKWEGAIAGGLLGLFAGALLDQFKPRCKICPRTFPPKFR